MATRRWTWEERRRMEAETSRERFDEIDMKRIGALMAEGPGQYWENLFKDVPDKSLLGRLFTLLGFLTRKKWTRCHKIVLWFTERTKGYRERKAKFDAHWNSRENPNDTCTDYVDLSKYN